MHLSMQYTLSRPTCQVTPYWAKSSPLFNFSCYTNWFAMELSLANTHRHQNRIDGCSLSKCFLGKIPYYSSVTFATDRLVKLIKSVFLKTSFFKFFFSFDSWIKGKFRAEKKLESYSCSVANQQFYSFQNSYKWQTTIVPALQLKNGLELIKRCGHFNSVQKLLQNYVTGYITDCSAHLIKQIALMGSGKLLFLRNLSMKHRNCWTALS